MFELPEEGTVTVDIRNISDIDERVDVLKDRICFIGGLMANSRSVVIRCIAGINRSNVLACGVMCLLKPLDDLEETWHKHQKTVCTNVPRANFNPILVDTVKEALWKTKRYKTRGYKPCQH